MAADSPLRLIASSPPAPAPARRCDAGILAALTLAWTVIAVLVDPRGGFPLNDDWAYGSVALRLAEHGRFEPSFWQSMPLVTPALWGAAFARVFGASWFALRLSSLTAGWLALVGTFALLRELGWSRARATAGAAALIVNPWMVALSFTFMSDVPFLAAVVWSAWAWLRAVGRGDARWLVLAAALAIAAVLSRQIGLALPLAFALPAWRRRAFGRCTWLAVLAPIVLTVLAIGVHDHLRHLSAVSPASYDEKSEALVRGAAGLLRLRGWGHVVGRIVVVLAYLGLFALPVTLVSRRDSAARPGRLTTPAICALGALGALVVLAAGWSMPLAGNIIIDFGIGPRTVAGAVTTASPWGWRAITITAGVGAALLVRALAGAWRDGRAGGGLDGQRWKPMACALLAATLFAPSAAADTSMFDRHMLVLLPFLLAATAGEAVDAVRAPRVVAGLATLACALLAVFSVAGTHDYLAWQRARWTLVKGACAAGVRPTDLRGGFEIDNLPDARAGVHRTALADRSAAPYVVSIAPLAGHREIRRVEVRAWLPGAVRAVYLLAAPLPNPLPA
ncbi:MAG TPA: glycosyltransferase family 39 protein, partial [Polyangia bacterium]